MIAWLAFFPFLYRDFNCFAWLSLYFVLTKLPIEIAGPILGIKPVIKSKKSFLLFVNVAANLGIAFLGK